jgi:hypothetical protein
VEGCSYVQEKFFEIKEEDILRPNPQDFKEIYESWQEYRKEICDSVSYKNKAIIREFKRMKNICIYADGFDDFLDSLSLVGYSNHIEVSSPYSEYTSRAFGWDDAYGLVYSYIEELIKRGELILVDFDTCDDVFVYGIDEKFGYDDYEEEETTEEDDSKEDEE